VLAYQGVQNKSILEVAQELNTLQQLGKNNQLKPEHIAPGTFTLSNIGTVGGTYVKPVIVAPQVRLFDTVSVKMRQLHLHSFRMRV
jgi:2-oxoisovalerate dehydrogenase E2 component (dihydrolipoyl transacylase)